tara:strand:- start:189 stop:560 length:372 start_codon:yes stop_codon:yes gene_type:complete
MSKSRIVDKDGNIIDQSAATIPSDKYFRNAWALSGSVITEDLTVAKQLFKEKIREVRKPLLDEQDVLFMKALEDGDTSAQNTIKTKKQTLRDAPAASAITNASNITQLKAAWDTTNLGTNPYS